MDLCLTPAELERLTGLKLPRCQVRRLRADGFWRARLGRDGSCILERAHYEAVCRGALQATAAKVDTPRPKLHLVREA